MTLSEEEIINLLRQKGIKEEEALYFDEDGCIYVRNNELRIWSYCSPISFYVNCVDAVIVSRKISERFNEIPVTTLLENTKRINNIAKESLKAFEEEREIKYLIQALRDIESITK